MNKSLLAAAFPWRLQKCLVLWSQKITGSRLILMYLIFLKNSQKSGGFHSVIMNDRMSFWIMNVQLLSSWKNESNHIFKGENMPFCSQTNWVLSVSFPFYRMGNKACGHSSVVKHMPCLHGPGFHSLPLQLGKSFTWKATAGSIMKPPSACIRAGGALHPSLGPFTLSLLLLLPPFSLPQAWATLIRLLLHWSWVRSSATLLCSSCRFFF